MQRVVAIPYRRFETTYSFQDVGPVSRPETSERNYHYWLHNSPEERSSHLLGAGILKSSENENITFSFKSVNSNFDKLKQFVRHHEVA
jgi:predicted transcriptional regulator